MNKQLENYLKKALARANQLHAETQSNLDAESLEGEFKLAQNLSLPWIAKSASLEAAIEMLLEYPELAEEGFTLDVNLPS